MIERDLLPQALTDNIGKENKDFLMFLKLNASAEKESRKMIRHHLWHEEYLTQDR
ncbi:MAG: hypothetical protein JXA72_12495 [Bacteroidales bacterium]|nr:hypothetical protein [Bacteroidales bacterium]